MPYFNVHAIRDDVPTRVYFPEDVEFTPEHGGAQRSDRPGDDRIGGTNRDTVDSADPPKEVLLLHRVHADTPEDAVSEAFRILSGHVKSKQAHSEWVRRFQAGRQAGGFRIYLADVSGGKVPGISWLVQQGVDGLVAWDEYDLHEAMRSNADQLAETIREINEESSLPQDDKSVEFPEPDVVSGVPELDDSNTKQDDAKHEE